jgi:hypothetical protein
LQPPQPQSDFPNLTDVTIVTDSLNFLFFFLCFGIRMRGPRRTGGWSRIDCMQGQNMMGTGMGMMQGGMGMVPEAAQLQRSVMPQRTAIAESKAFRQSHAKPKKPWKKELQR